MDYEKEIKGLKEENKNLKEKVDKLIGITQKYYDFWLNGTALEPIYKSFINKLEELKV